MKKYWTSHIFNKYIRIKKGNNMQKAWPGASSRTLLSKLGVLCTLYVLYSMRKSRVHIEDVILHHFGSCTLAFILTHILGVSFLWALRIRARICKHLRSPGIDSKESIPPAYVACAGIFKQSMGDRNRVGIGLSYRPAKLNRLAEFIPWNRFLGSLKV